MMMRRIRQYHFAIAGSNKLYSVECFVLIPDREKMCDGKFWYNSSLLSVKKAKNFVCDCWSALTITQETAIVHPGFRAPSPCNNWEPSIQAFTKIVIAHTFAPCAFPVTKPADNPLARAERAIESRL